MAKIKLLERELSNMISAGEVVERPASVVKELVENAIDALADSVTVEIKNGGKTYIRVTDNGVGMDLVDARNAFLCHATSKIRTVDDLFNIVTMGFRGEAIPAIASVSKVELLTVGGDEKYGNRLVYEAGTEIYCEQIGLAPGTTFIVKDLFYNVPARLKFLKKDSTETSNIISLVNKFAIGNPDISFQLIVDGKSVLTTSKDSDLKDIIYTVYGKEITENLLEVKFNDYGTKIEGYVCKPRCSRSNRNFQLFYVNGRVVKNKSIIAALDRAYHNRMMTGKHPIAILKIKVSPRSVDVNVHPTKTEIRFSDEQKIFDAVYYAITNALNDESSFDVSEPEIPASNGDSMKQAMNDFYKEVYSFASSVPATEVSSVINVNGLKVQTIDLSGSTLSSKKTETNDSFDKFFSPPKNYGNLRDFENVAPVEKFPDQYSRFSKVPLTELSQKYFLDVEGQNVSFFDENASFNYIGELFKTYIVVERGNDFFLIDKHAAHERILFNKIQKTYRESKKYSQELLSSIPVTLTPEELTAAWDNKDKIEKLGFVFDEFGKNQIIIRAIPYVMSHGDIVPTFIEFVNYLMENKKIDIAEFEDSAIKMLSCKAAIKAGYDTPEQELRLFVEKLIKDGNINYCPHGRPIVCRFTKTSIEKAFKRIV